MARGQKPVKAYLESLREAHGTGKATGEQSYKSKLEALLTAIGDTLDPKLFATMELKSEGAGHPDLGVFEKKSNNMRLAIEVKPAIDNLYDTARGEQVSKYWKQYGYVLATNFREFVLVARHAESGEARIEAKYQISSTPEAFWRSTPTSLAADHEQGLTDYLTGVMLRPSPILRPKDLAADLARHAREARRRLGRHSIDDIRPLQEAFEQSLGLTFEDEKGQRFFRSSLVQTLFYGLFSGWMLWKQTIPKGRKPGEFDWKEASEYLALPLLADLFEEVAKPKRLRELDLREPLDWATASLNRVNHEAFFKTFDQDHAITLFYEPFLEAFDPELRKELGVWYTPPEIVKYMVGRVDQLLRSELGIADGLADERVYVLDPAAGTGSYLLEVARKIHETLDEQGHGALAAAKVKKAMCERVFGFEILTAPYVVAHLQLGVILREMGAKLAAKDRVGVYLTNALTGWEPPRGVKATSAFQFLQDEQDAAAKVKREAPIIVILGNPPYNRFAGVAEAEEADLIDPYKKGLYDKWGVRKQLLDDLYIRFFRLAEKRIAEASGRGIVCYISNYSWLDGLSHPIMRDHLLHAFDAVYIDNCNGDKFKTGKRTPDGKSDQSMFTTDDHPVGIEPGTAIATLVARGKTASTRKSRVAAQVRARELWGMANAKRAALLSSLKTLPNEGRSYRAVKPAESVRWVISSGVPSFGTVSYGAWVRLVDLFPVHYSGHNENRQNALITLDRRVLESRMRSYFDSSVKDDAIAEICPELMLAAAGYDPHAVRKGLLKSKTRFDAALIVPFAYRPFDQWLIYWQGESKLHNRPRPDFFEQCWKGNLFLSASQTGRKGGFNEPLIVDKFGDLHLQDPWSQFFPLWIRHEGLLNGDAIEPNVDENVLASVCRSRGVPARTKDGHSRTRQAMQCAEQVFFSTLTTLWSPAYRSENATALRQDWPRIPIPSDPKVLAASAELGRRLADLLLPDRSVPSVTSGKLRPELKELGIPIKVGGKSGKPPPIDPDKDLDVTAGWGFRGHKNAVMSGKGRTVPTESDPDGAIDVFINDSVCWRNVPRDVWEMTIGGYPVVKKWLSYREKRVLGRALKMEEMTYITEVVRRLKAILLMGAELDENYRACAKETISLKKGVDLCCSK